MPSLLKGKRNKNKSFREQISGISVLNVKLYYDYVKFVKNVVETKIRFCCCCLVSFTRQEIVLNILSLLFKL